jgi:hypothetical protein
MVEPALIQPDQVYDDGILVLTLGLSSAALARARRRGELRFARRGRRTFYLGQWILDWLKADLEKPGQPVATTGALA